MAGSFGRSGRRDQGRRLVRHQRLGQSQCAANKASIDVSVHVLSSSYLGPTHLGPTAQRPPATISLTPKPRRRLVRKVNLISAAPLKRTEPTGDEILCALQGESSNVGEARGLGELLRWHDAWRPRTAESPVTVHNDVDAILQSTHNGITTLHGIRYRGATLVNHLWGANAL